MEFLIINNRIEQNFQSFQNLRRRKLLTFDVSYPLASKPNLSPSRRYDRVKRVGGGEDTRKTALAGLRWGCVQDKERAGSKSRLLSWLTRIVRQHCSPLFDYRAFVYTIQPRGFLLSNRSRVIRLSLEKRGWKRVEMGPVIERARKSLAALCHGRPANFSCQRVPIEEIESRLSGMGHVITLAVCKSGA